MVNVGNDGQGFQQRRGGVLTDGGWSWQEGFSVSEGWRLDEQGEVAG